MSSNPYENFEIVDKTTGSGIVLSNSPSYLNEKSSSGRWTSEEHDRFVEGFKKYGADWKAVSDYVGTRTVTQVCHIGAC